MYFIIPEWGSKYVGKFAKGLDTSDIFQEEDNIPTSSSAFNIINEEELKAKCNYRLTPKAFCNIENESDPTVYNPFELPAN
ncbi:unnamed protein product [Aphis gossypii]|uniref:Uncharacterized protein n=1 Tax=Aphis gossypii TaxID=80765 RepID=A0A9P0J3G5_APHGO|nr:unnamed protein product [Aphis gossypii]